MDLPEWSSHLFGDAIVGGRPGRRLYLYMDRDLLGRLAGTDASSALADFCRAFRAAMGGRPFAVGAELARRWRARGFDGEPSFVAHLAMTVLAVTEEPLGGQHGIYRRQNELLGLPAEPVAPPGYGEDVPLMWRIWNEWLDGPGSVYGCKSARTHEHWRLQGWARSQGLIRFQDRLRIERFFDDLGLVAGEPPTVEMLQTWLRYRGEAGQALLDLLDDEAAREIVQDVLDDEATRWLEEGPRPQRGARMRGLLQYDDWAETFGGALVVDPAWSGLPLNLGAGERHTVDEFDDYLLVTLDVTEDELLGRGVEHRLAEGVTARFGGEDLYVLRDEPRVNGRLQCRAIDGAPNHHLLVRHTVLAEVQRALEGAGLAPQPRRSIVEGWSWIENLRLDHDSDVLRLLGLTPLVPAAVDKATLEGGLAVGPVYLTGGEPDVLLPAGVRALIDEQPLAALPGQQRVCLAHLYLDVGDHLVESTAGNVSFKTVAFIRDAASSGGVAIPIDGPGASRLFAEPTRLPEAAEQLSGALLSGVDVADRLVLRSYEGAELLALTEAGEVLEIWPRPPGWLARIGLRANAVDVVSAVRTTASPAAFLVIRNRRTHSKRGIAIPPGLARRPGHTPSRERADLVGELVSDRAQWAAPPDSARATAILTSAMRRSRHTAVPASLPKLATPPSLREDVVAGAVVANPYDDVLAWISEQESGRVAATRFAEAWGWTCRRYGLDEIAGDWRLALTTLTALGHVERDFSRQQVAVAPAALVTLPEADGLSLLTGARPTRVLERIDDPDDEDDVVARATVGWSVHRRTALDAAGRPAAPTAVFVEWDRGERSDVCAGLSRLGLSLTGCTSDVLLKLQPTIGQIAADGGQYSMSPGREMWLWRRTPDGEWTWSRRMTDDSPGLYRYRLTRGNLFAWRPRAGALLVEVDPATGQWLSRATAGQVALLRHSPLLNVLLVPATASLPRLLSRALVLRTGLPPYKATVAAGHYSVYENVDATTAEHVARVLKQDLQAELRDVERER